MAANGVEVAHSYVTIIAKAPGLAASINKALGSVDVGSTAKKIGKQMSDQVGKSLKDQVAKKFADATAAALDKQTTATKKLADAEHALVKSRAQHGTTSAKLSKAEEQLAKLRESGKASAADLEKAEAALAKAEADRASSSRSVVKAQNSVTEAKRNSEVASKEYADAVEREGSKAARSQEWMNLASARLEGYSAQWRTAGDKLSGVGQSIASKVTKPVTIAASAVGTLMGALGFKRLVGIDTARGQFKGLGLDADAVMKQVDAGVNNTALSMAEGAGLAVGILATGNLPLEQLESQLKRVANVSAAYGVDSSQAGYLLNNVLTKNKVTYGDLSQMVQNNIPIISSLAKHYGVAGDEIQKMAERGEISIEDFNTVLDQNAGAAAEAYAGTWKGVTSNILSNLGKIGAKFLEPAFKVIQEQAAEFLTFLKTPEFGAAATSIGEQIGQLAVRGVEALKSLVKWWAELSPAGKKAVGVIAGIALTIGPVLMLVGKLAAGVGAVFKVFQVGIPIVAAFGRVLMANPIGMIITAVGLLVSALVWFFTQTETGKAIWAEFTRFLGEAWANISGFFTAAYENVIKPVFEGISEAVQNVGDFFVTVWTDYLKPVFDGIAKAAKWVFETILVPIFQVFQFAFAVAAGLIVGTYEALIAPMFEAFGALLNWLYETIVKPVLDGIGIAFQWLNDNVISPVVLGIQIALAALGAVFTWLWVNAIKPTFDFIGAIFTWIYSVIIQPIIDKIVAAFNFWGLVFTALWVNQIKPTVDAIGSVFRWLWDNVIKPVWDGIFNTIQSVWTKIKSVIDIMVKVVQGDPKKAFEAARDGIKTAWEAIQEIAKKPVRFVVETVFGGLVDAVNGFLPDGMKIPRPALPKGFSDGGYTGNIAANAVAGIVHGNEHVIRASSRRSIEASHPGLLDHMNKYGTVPGYKKGGLVHPLPGSVVTTQWMGYPGHTGMDFAKPQGTPIQAAAAGVVSKQFYHHNYGNMVDINHGGGFSTRYAHMLANVAVRLGQAVKAGQVVGYEGSTGNSTGPHLHFETLQNGSPMNPAPYLSGASSVTPAFGIIDGLLDGAISKFKGAFPGGGFFVDAAAGLMKSGVKGFTDWISEKLSFGIGGGGITPMLYDNGGWLQPGMSLVNNKTGRPEPIFTGNEFDQIVGARGGGDIIQNNTFNEVNSDARVMLRHAGRELKGAMA